MKLFYVILILFFFNNCSFDNKSGIWKNENSISKNENNLFKDFKKLSSSKNSFEKIVKINKDFNFKLPKPVNNFEWRDIFYNQSNNFDNFKYNNINQSILKSKKLSKYNLNKKVLFENNNLITNDEKGNLIVFSVNENKIISKFNFYKKRFKKIKKSLNLIVENNIIYISDNIGFIYAYNYKINEIVWAKNYKIPFRSNLKISNNKLIAANQNNSLFFLNIKNGDELSSIPTEETFVKNQFVNNLSLKNNSLFFLNTYGSLYSVNIDTMRINWFINLNQSIEMNPSNLFLGSQIVNHKGKVVVSTNEFTYIVNSETGSIIHKKNIPSSIKPVILNDYVFIVTNNSLLVVLNLVDGKIIYSNDINQDVANFLNIKKNKIIIKNFLIANSNIFIFLKNSYVLQFDIRGNLNNVSKLPTKIYSQNILIDGSILYIDKKNRLSVID